MILRRQSFLSKIIVIHIFSFIFAREIKNISFPYSHITFANAKGIPSRLIMLRYAARNAILPNLTGFGMALGFMLSGALLTEMIFSYPGQGFLLLQAVTSQDYPLMQGIFMTITFAVLGANWLVDIAILFLDPRTRK